MVQNVCMNPYFDISSKTQICQKCHLRSYCIQPSNSKFTLRICEKSGSRIDLCYTSILYSLLSFLLFRLFSHNKLHVKFFPKSHLLHFTCCNKNKNWRFEWLFYYCACHYLSKIIHINLEHFCLQGLFLLFESTKLFSLSSRAFLFSIIEGCEIF